MRIKDVVTLRNEKTTDNTMPYIALDNIISWDAKYVESNTETEGTNSIFKKGDVLFGKLRPYLAKGFCPSYDGICSTEFFVMTPKKGFSPHFLLYYFLSVPFIDYIKNQVAGVKMPRTKWDDFGGISVNIPSYDEQLQIVDYLDKKLSAIDDRVEVLEKEKDAYARLKKSIINQAVTHGLNPHVSPKDSGIGWMGMIPNHWERYRLKDIGYMYGGLTGKSGDDFRCDDESITKPYVPFTNVLNNTVVDLKNFPRVVMGENEVQNRVEEGDLLFLMSSEDYESIAKSAVVIGNPGEVYLNSFCRGLRVTDKNCFAPFINYQLNSEIYRDALRFQARGFTRINIKIDRVASHFICLPPLSEQQAIADYLNEKCSKIDAAIENINKQIEASKRLKKAVINEAIGGKIQM